MASDSETPDSQGASPTAGWVDHDDLVVVPVLKSAPSPRADCNKLTETFREASETN